MFEVNAEIGSMRLHGEIGGYFENGVDAIDVIHGLESMDGQDVTLNLKSDGGDVFEGMSIVNAIRSYDGQVTVVVDSLAASIASVIASAADEVAIHNGSMMMIHDPFSGALGNAEEFRAVADLLDKVAGEIANVYASKSGRDAGEFLDLMKQDTYFTAQEAVEAGLADRIIEGKKKGSSRPANVVVAASAFPRRIAAQHRLRKSLTSKGIR